MNGRDVAAVAAAWLLTIGIDFHLHGGLLAFLYAQQHPFLLEPVQAFLRIPLGYASFLLLTIALWWLMRRSDVGGAAHGARIGLAVGAVLWGAFLLGLYSISIAPPALLAGWWIGQTLELAAAGAVIGAVNSGASCRRVWIFVGGLVLALLLGTIALQAAGVAPAMKTV